MNIARIAIFVGALFSVLGIAAAQERMAPIPAEKRTEAQQKAVEEWLADSRRQAEYKARGWTDMAEVGKRPMTGQNNALLRTPEFFTRLQKMGSHLRYDSSIGMHLTELVIIMTIRETGQQFEWNAHDLLARQAGWKPEVLAAIAESRRPLGLAEDEEVVFDFITEVRQKQSVSDATYERAVKKLGEQGVVEMIGIRGYFLIVGLVANVVKSGPRPGEKATLPFFPRGW